jgi:hypothetical protein
MKSLSSKIHLSVVARNNSISHKPIFLWILLFTIFVFSLTESQLVTGTELDHGSIFTEGSLSPDMKSLLTMTSYSPYSMLSSSSDRTFTHSLADPGNVLPPRIEMNYNGSEYDGQLIAYEFRRTDSFSQLSPLTKELSVRDIQNGELKNLIISPDGILTNINQSSMELKIENGSKMKFAVTNSPSQLPPASLSILAYTLNPVQAVKVLNVDDQDPTSTSFRIDLENEGKHLLMATATWSPFFSGDDQNNYISGYAIYVWPTDIV